MTYPKESEREIIMEIVFASFVRIKDYTLLWLSEAFKEVPGDILTEPDIEEILTNLNKIDVSHLKFKNKEKRDREEEVKVWDQFDEYIELFEYR